MVLFEKSFSVIPDRSNDQIIARGIFHFILHLQISDALFNWEVAQNNMF